MKSTLIRDTPRRWLVLLACVFIIGGLFFSRALMSIGMMTLVGNALVSDQLRENWRSFISQKHLMGWAVYFFGLALTFFWSDNQAYFFERIQIALPFLCLPFAFASFPPLSPRDWNGLLLVFLVLVLGGMIWSLGMYASHKPFYDAGYAYSKVMPTPFQNDHIRFSLAVLLGIGIGIDLFLQTNIRWQKLAFVFFALFSVVYLHVLAVKTGLFLFYGIGFSVLIRFLFLPAWRNRALVSLLVLGTLPFVMYHLSDSFKNKWHYFIYSLYEMRNQSAQPQVSDEGRVISYRYALEAIAHQKLRGCGLGDVQDIMHEYYRRDFPTQENIALLPHNQFLMATMSVGIGFGLLLLGFFLYLGKIAYQKGSLSFIFWIMMGCSMMIEPLFETQYGTCIFLFFLLVLLQRRTAYT